MRLLATLVVLVLVGTLAGCGDDDDNNNDVDTTPLGITSPTSVSASPSAGGSEGAEVSVELVDFSVIADASSPAGDVTFNIENTGPEHAHEFVVIRTDLDAANLPTADDGSVDEEGDGIEVIDEVEEIAEGASETLSVNLDAGHYALICNIVEEHSGETFVHYDRGMYTDFTVE
ncbi:MAG: hypothetical protein WEB52_16055 [Dehalococcoidia bacterium]